MESVVAIQIGKNGVKGPAQKASAADAIIKHIFHLKIRYNKKQPHTGEYIIVTTNKNIINVFQSQHSFFIHLKKLNTFSFISFIIIPLHFDYTIIIIYYIK